MTRTRIVAFRRIRKRIARSTLQRKTKKDIPLIRQVTKRNIVHRRKTKISIEKVPLVAKINIAMKKIRIAIGMTRTNVSPIV